VIGDGSCGDIAWKIKRASSTGVVPVGIRIPVDLPSVKTAAPFCIRSSALSARRRPRAAV
jgi:hypothetical protein